MAHAMTVFPRRRGFGAVQRQQVQQQATPGPGRADPPAHEEAQPPTAGKALHPPRPHNPEQRPGRSQDGQPQVGSRSRRPRCRTPAPPPLRRVSTTHAYPHSWRSPAPAKIQPDLALGGEHRTVRGTQARPGAWNLASPTTRAAAGGLDEPLRRPDDLAGRRGPARGDGVQVVRGGPRSRRSRGGRRHGRAAPQRDQVTTLDERLRPRSMMPSSAARSSSRVYPTGASRRSVRS